MRAPDATEAAGTGEVAILDSVEPLAEEWDALSDRCEAPPFLRPGWVGPWWEAFGAGRLAIVVARRDGRLTGVLPMVARASALVSPTNWHTPMFSPVAESDEDLAALARGLIGRRASWYDLSFLDPESPAVVQLHAGARAAGHRVIVRVVARSPYIPTDGDWEGYRATLSRKRRKELGRLRRRLEEAGEVTLEFDGGTDDLDARLAEGLALEGSGWKERKGTAILSQPNVERFYRQVAGWAAQRGWLRLAFLRLDGRAIAFDLCLEAGGVAYVLKGGFDVRHRSLSPGALLTYESLARAFGSDLRSYELLGSDDEYKLAWTAHTRSRVRLQAFPPSPAGRLAHLAWARGRPLARRVRAAVLHRPAGEGGG